MTEPSILVTINRERIEAHDPASDDLPPPELRFYAFVQHEGDVVVLKQHNPCAIVSIGQSFAMEHNFLEPQHVREPWDDGSLQHGCECEDGVVGKGERLPEGFDLRNVEVTEGMDAEDDGSMDG